MIFQLKTRIFSLGGSMDITDFQGIPYYQVQASFFSIGKKLDLFDMQGNQLAHIQQRLLAFAPEYDIYQQGQLVATIKQHLFSLFGERFTVESSMGMLEIAGDWVNWNYSVDTNGMTVASITKEFAMFQDVYAVNILDGADIPLLLSLAIVVDEVASGHRGSQGGLGNTILDDLL
jgi:uncharacterized protein YxjI